MHRLIPAAALAAAILAATPVCAQQPPSLVGAPASPAAPPANSVDDPDGWGGFDFLIGDWKAHLRKLEKPLSGSNVWVDYQGTSRTRKLAGGRANFEDFEVTSKDGKRQDGQTLRLYNPASGEWHIHLLDAAHGQLLTPPTIGRFRNGRGELYDYEVFGGRAILVRYVWTHEGKDKAHFVQAFSIDGGRTWEDNWVLDLVRE
ncbi:DUF1579 domain-containing protein [Phenylobacterium sp.]|uniref:DUF1579 domain-containing protein n=1 Tax=Phenylobacterium sp. TaxID=1871053 RepID=UPI0025DE1A5A|nr:DUF1579 domain-containing protein [Phenylobacterium sp.]